MKNKAETSATSVKQHFIGLCENKPLWESNLCYWYTAKLLAYSPEASPFLPNCSPDWLPFNQIKDIKILLGPKPVLSPPGHLLSLLCGQQHWGTGRAGSRFRHFPCRLVLQQMPGPQCSCSFRDTTQNMLLFTNYWKRPTAHLSLMILFNYMCQILKLYKLRCIGHGNMNSFL